MNKMANRMTYSNNHNDKNSHTQNDTKFMVWQE